MPRYTHIYLYLGLKKKIEFLASYPLKFRFWSETTIFNWLYAVVGVLEVSKSFFCYFFLFYYDFLSEMREKIEFSFL